MDDQSKRTAIRAYFAAKPKWPWWCVPIGALLLLSGISGGRVGAGIFGLLVLSLGVAVLAQGKARISDAEYDRFRDADLHHVVSVNALRKWGIDESELVGDPPCVWVPAPSYTNASLAVKRGDDGVIRFNPIRVVVIGFAQNQLLAYEGVLDMTTGAVVNEQTQEFFYQDVVSVSTRVDSVKATWKGQEILLNDTETFWLTTSGATEIKVPIRSLQFARMTGGGDLPNTLADRAVAAVRAMLRQRKRVPAA